MTTCDLIEKPIWEAQSLGCPIPNSTHAVSVALPRWRDVVGYEEKAPEVMARLSTGYPRFVVHPLVETLGRHLADSEPCLPFPSRRVAEMAMGFAQRTPGAEATLV
ncbi:MAG: PLP-dependent transferase, partial [Limisphaerales bacterium]